MGISYLKIGGWRQFADVDLEFHPRLTVITGANGAGKSTMLRVLAQHFGWTPPLLATPVLSTDGVVRYFSGWFDWLKFRPSAAQSEVEVGTIGYSSGKPGVLTLPNAGGVQYQLTIKNQQGLQGLHIGSHRPMPVYQQVQNIPTNPIGADTAFHLYTNEMTARYQNGHTGYSPTYRMKEAIISMALFGPGNADVAPNAQLATVLSKFKKVLSEILPPTIGFKTISVRIPDVVIVTETGDFVIDAASGGLMSLIDLAWQIFLYSQDKESFVVTFDEPENHLHPSMQRHLIGSLIRAFPTAQFIVATHSPFIVSSVRDSHVYVLRYVQSEGRQETGLSRRVSSLKLDHANKAGTASEILRDVLGVPVTLPEWAEDDLKQIAGRFSIQQLDTQTLAELRGQLDAVGLGEFYPDALKRIASPT